MAGSIMDENLASRTRTSSPPESSAAEGPEEILSQDSAREQVLRNHYLVSNDEEDSSPVMLLPLSQGPRNTSHLRPSDTGNSSLDTSGVLGISPSSEERNL